MGNFNLSQKAISEVEHVLSLTDKDCCNETIIDAYEELALIDDYLRQEDISAGGIKEALYNYRMLVEACYKV